MGRSIGSVLDAHAGLIHAALPGAAVGDGVDIRAGEAMIRGVVQAVANGASAIAPHGLIDGVAAGDLVTTTPAVLTLPLESAVLGARSIRVVTRLMEKARRTGHNAN